MANLSAFLQQKLLEHALRATDYAEPATVYVGLYTAAPTDAGGGTEVTGGSYARVAVTFAAYSSGSVTTSGVTTFPTATADWGTVTHWGIFDALTVGNLMIWQALTASATVNNTDTARFSAGALTVSLD